MKRLVRKFPVFDRHGQQKTIFEYVSREDSSLGGDLKSKMVDGNLRSLELEDGTQVVRKEKGFYQVEGELSERFLTSDLPDAP